MARGMRLPLELLGLPGELGVGAAFLTHIGFVGNWSLSELNLWYCKKGCRMEWMLCRQPSIPLDNESYKI